jgi:DNA-binding transcriptional ArsR family regulator
MGEVDLAAVGALVGEPSRAAMLDALLAGRALTVGELAAVAAVSRATASEHLARLREGGLVEVVVQGRHRYHRLSGPEVGWALEALSHVAPPRPVGSLREVARARSLSEARTCYDHLAGRCGVLLHDHLVSVGWLRPIPGGYELSDHGRAHLQRWHVDVGAAEASRRKLARPCLDWTERRPHLAGALAAELARALLDGPRPWFVRRAVGHRGLRLTETGRHRLSELGWRPSDDEPSSPEPNSVRPNDPGNGGCNAQFEEEA